MTSASFSSRPRQLEPALLQAVFLIIRAGSFALENVTLTIAAIRANRPSPRRTMTFKIGIISDTRGLLRPEAKRRLNGVDHIVHAGDIGDPDIIAALRLIAPVTAIRGNVDTGDWAGYYPDKEFVRLADRSIFVLQDLKSLQIDPVALVMDVVVSGHSHVPNISTVNDVLYVNPGSAGRRRFSLPVTLATLDVRSDGLRPSILDLGGG